MGEIEAGFWGEEPEVFVVANDRWLGCGHDAGLGRAGIAGNL